MLVTARVDLTEGSRIVPPAGLSAKAAEDVTVRIYPPDASYTDLPYAQSLAAALDAVRRCRLISEGHAYDVHVQPAVAAAHFLTIHHYYLPAEGRELEARRG